MLLLNLIEGLQKKIVEARRVFSHEALDLYKSSLILNGQKTSALEYKSQFADCVLEEFSFHSL